MSNLKVGDRVLVTDKGNEPNPKIKSEIGTIRKINNNQTRSIGVEFDNYINGHSQFGDISGHSWWCREQDMIKIETVGTKTDKGDKDMTELLNQIYKNISRNISDYIEGKRKEIEDNNKNVKKIKEIEKTINSLDENVRHSIDFSYCISEKVYTNEELIEIRKIREEQLQLEKDLENKMENAEAQLSICDTYEQKMEVLKAYGFIDDSGKIIA